MKESDHIATKISLTGVVQGVGFRPFVFNLAERFGLQGWVLNNSSGVEIEVEGPSSAVQAFTKALQSEAPPLSCIESLRAIDEPPHGYTGFEIRHSERQEGHYQLISPDIATCSDCLRELLDPADRRYRYPFTNCTNCGPRFTIIADIPYDRPHTTMRVFSMCPDCQQEYDDPRNRRFHAQPNACPVCGPRLELVLAGGQSASPSRSGGRAEDVIRQAAEMLRGGAILAIKGLGGFHLACDATNAGAVRTLRARKRRPDKPFAVMMATLDEIKTHCAVSRGEEALLTSPQCPIVLLPWRSTAIAREVAPGYRHLGAMLPYTPLHHVLLRDVNRPLVMTSGNLTEEPIAAENEEAVRRLGHLADAFVLHNRDIYARYDDSVWFVPAVPDATSPSAPEVEYPQPIRRARGYAPFPIKLPFRAQQILACGAEIKNTFCLTRDEYAFVSQHIGDMENLQTMEHLERTVELYKHLFRIDPQVIAYDMHPDYMATRYANRILDAGKATPVAVQHHHAHLASCLADNGWLVESGPVIGVSLDGTGYGTDGQIWGGEWLVGDYRSYRRAAHLEYLPLPGGDAATRNPWRSAFSYLYALLGQVPDWVIPPGVQPDQVTLLQQQIDRRFNCPLTSSMGRLFDAVAAMVQICTRTTYEAQAAIALEIAASPLAEAQSSLAPHVPSYPCQIRKEGEGMIVVLRELLAALISDVRAQVPADEIALRFHHTIAMMTVEVCRRVASDTGVDVVALSGGCFQNRLLFSLTLPALQRAGFKVLTHRQVPCNDGGLSLGQAAIAEFASQSTSHHDKG